MVLFPYETFLKIDNAFYLFIISLNKLVALAKIRNFPRLIDEVY